uniref:Uncharacterized protein n=1 Tax=viral metagenome TaxID=1070528 RepID=A0A6C0ATQ1_9ZZZZ
MNFPKLNISFTQLCTPALIYLIIAIIGMVFSLMTMNAMSIVVNLVFIGIWTWFLNFLCTKGYKTISWFLVVAPFVFLIFMFGITLDVVKNYAGTEQPPKQNQNQQPPAPNVVPYAKH